MNLKKPCRTFNMSKPSTSLLDETEKRLESEEDCFLKRKHSSENYLSVKALSTIEKTVTKLNV